MTSYAKIAEEEIYAELNKRNDIPKKFHKIIIESVYKSLEMNTIDEPLVMVARLISEYNLPGWHLSPFRYAVTVYNTYCPIMFRALCKDRGIDKINVYNIKHGVSDDGFICAIDVDDDVSFLRNSSENILSSGGLNFRLIKHQSAD